ncbi:MAG: hypothetical protein ACE5OR_17120, partial [bacterium]
LLKASFAATIVVGESPEEVLQRLSQWRDAPSEAQKSETGFSGNTIVSKGWNEFFGQYRIETSDLLLQKAHLYGLYIAKANAVEAMASQPPGITWPALLPSKVHYYGVWLWDIFFLGLPLVSTSEYRLVEGSLLTLLDNQHANGLIPIATFPTRQEPHPEPLTQAPVLAMAGWGVYRAKGFYEGEGQAHRFLRKVYPKLKSFHSFWYRERDRDGDGMCEYIHGWESGVDNSPYWDKRGAEGVEDLLLAIFMYLDWKYWAAMARVLGLKDEERDFLAEAQRIEETVLTEFYDRETGLFYPRYFDTHELIRIKTFESLLPLLLDGIGGDQRRSIVSHLTDPKEFWTEYPVPTVAVDEPTFGSKFSGAWWRKPVWLSANWLILKGLMKWGYYTEAKCIIDRTVQLVLRSAREEFGKRRFGENYDPLNGKMTQGQVYFFGWNGLVSSMIVEFFGGIGFYHPVGHLVFDPICGATMRVQIFDCFVSTEKGRYTFGFANSRVLTADQGVRCEVMARSDQKITIRLDSRRTEPLALIAHGDYFDKDVRVRVEGTVVGVGRQVSWSQAQFPVTIDLMPA